MQPPVHSGKKGISAIDKSIRTKPMKKFYTQIYYSTYLVKINRYILFFRQYRDKNFIYIFFWRPVEKIG